MNVRTYADGFGTWHAVISANGLADTPETRALARGAIAYELLTREHAHGSYLSSFTVQLQDTVTNGAYVTLNYVEVSE